MLPELTALARLIEDDIVERHRTAGTLDARGSLTGRRSPGRALARLARDVPDGGRLVVDARSRDHLTAVLAAHEEVGSRARRRLGRLRGLVSREELVAAADGAGLAIAAVVPYGALLGGPQRGLSHLAALEGTHRWRRTLSWLPEEPGLTELVLTIERSLVARLPTAVAHRMVVVLDRRADPAGNAGWLRSEAAAAAAWTDGGVAVGEVLPGDVVAELDPLLEPPHARYLAFALLDAVQQRLPRLDARRVLTGPRAEQYLAWRRALAVDGTVTRFMREWARGCRPRYRRSVDTTLAVDYQLVADVLERQLGLFGEVR